MEHDGSYHALFSNPELVEDLLRNFVDVSFVDSLNFSTLKRENAKFHSEALERRDGDIIYYVESFDGSPIYLYLFLEFQSIIDKWMPVRACAYVTLFYQHLIKQKRLTEKGLLPPVFSLVLYNGDAAWTAVQSLTSLIDLPAKHVLSAYQPAMRFYLIDESRFPTGKQNSLSGVLFKLENAMSPQEAFSGLAELGSLLQHHQSPTGVKRAFEAWIRYVLAPSLQMELKLEHIEELVEGKAMLKGKMTRWAQEYKEQGLVEG